jgi:hypothetical protein
LAPCVFAGRRRSLPRIGSLPTTLALQVLQNTSTLLPCHFSPLKWKQHVSPKRRHRPANTHGANTQDLYNNMMSMLFMLWDETKSLNCGHQRAYFSTIRRYMNTESNGGMTQTGENRKTRERNLSIATNSRWTDPGANPVLRGKRPAANSLSKAWSRKE